MTEAPNLLNMTGKTALVVGGTSGIGNGIAQALRAQGAVVHVWGRRGSVADYSAEEGSDLTGLIYRQVDVANLDDVATIVPEFEKLDTLVLSQGAVLYRRAEFEMDGFSQVVNVNLHSVMACAMKFKPMLSSTRGSVIVISSTGAYRSTMGNPAYAASKAGTLGLIRSLAEAWAADGIRVNGIAPGMVDTRMTKATTEKPERLQAMLASIPAGRLGTPDDIAGAALYLASPLANYVLGQMLVVDGGSLLS